MAEMANTESTGELPAKFGAAAKPGACRARARRGGRRRARNLAVPENVTLLFMPSHRPETGPMEEVVPHLREICLASRVFEGVATRTEAGRTGRGGSPAHPARWGR